MKKIALLTVLTFFCCLCSYGQSLFFLGQKSFPATEPFELQNNKESMFGSGLKVQIVKGGDSGLIVLSKEILGGGVRIQGDIFIYLEDGSVIKCVDRNVFDFLDNVATTVYYLTEGEINKLRLSNINTIRYKLKCSNCLMSSEEGSFSASNKASLYGLGGDKVDVPSLLSELFGEEEEEGGE